jgi:hypothetical protein
MFLGWFGTGWAGIGRWCPCLWGLKGSETQTRPDRADGESAPDVLEALSQDAMGRFEISQRILRSSSGVAQVCAVEHGGSHATLTAQLRTIGCCNFELTKLANHQKDRARIRNTSPADSHVSYWPVGSRLRLRLGDRTCWPLHNMSNIIPPSLCRIDARQAMHATPRSLCCGTLRGIHTKVCDLQFRLNNTQDWRRAESRRRKFGVPRSLKLRNQPHDPQPSLQSWQIVSLEVRASGGRNGQTNMAPEDQHLSPKLGKIQYLPAISLGSGNFFPSILSLHAPK